MHHRSAVVFASLALPLSAFAQPVVFVDDSAPPGGDGASWATAFDTLQAALTLAQGNPAVMEVYIGQGLYKPDHGPGLTLGDRTATFRLVNGAAVRGGFAGFGAPDPDMRNPSLFPTVLSGDLAGDDAPMFVNVSDNSLHVVTAMGSTAAVLDGCVVRAGNASLFGMDAQGAGALIIGGSPTLRSCVIEDNRALFFGGGAFLDAGSPLFDACVFRRNRAEVWGGGLYNNGAPRVSYCRFEDNSASNFGGAIFSQDGTAAILASVFVRNAADNGGAIHSFGATQTVVGSMFAGNTATTGDGGGLSSQGGASSLTNCVFSRNTAGAAGGGANGVGLSFFNCTLSANHASGSGGGVNGASPLLVNCVVWANTDSGGGGEAAQVRASSARPSLNRSCVQGLTGSLGGVGNIGSDPDFLDPDGADDDLGTADDDLRCAPGSPCIDAGDSAALPADSLDADVDANTAEPTPLDMDGAQRVQDDSGVADTGAGGPPTVDMGAYEFSGDSPGACPSDLDGDGVVNATDLGFVLGAWGGCPAPPALCPVDLDHDGVVNATDLGFILGAWGNCPD